MTSLIAALGRILRLMVMVVSFTALFRVFFSAYVGLMDSVIVLSDFIYMVAAILSFI
jgi:hypothetical protein